MEKLDKERQGEIYIFLLVILQGLFPVLTVLSFNSLFPLFSLGFSTLFGSLFFAFVLFARGTWADLKNKKAWKNIAGTTFFIGIAYYVLFFLGLHYTSAGNAIIISLAEVFSSFLFFHVLRKSYIPWQHIAGAMLILLGAGIVLYPNITGKFNIGDVLILLASFVAPIGNFFQQRARMQISPESILFVRNFGSSIFAFLFAYALGQRFSYNVLPSSIGFLLLNGILIFGFSKFFWIEGTHRISVTKANALSSVAPLFTLIFAWILLKNSPTIWQLTSLIPMFFGVILLSFKLKQKNDLA